MSFDCPAVLNALPKAELIPNLGCGSLTSARELWSSMSAIGSGGRISRSNASNNSSS